MRPPATDLLPPGNEKITKEELLKYDGVHQDVDNKIYIAIKGTIFDVSKNRDNYGPGKSYHVFTGKDSSRGLGKSSVKAEDANANIEDLDASELKVLDDWYSFFEKRYNIIGQVADGSKI